MTASFCSPSCVVLYSGFASIGGSRDYRRERSPGRTRKKRRQRTHWAGRTERRTRPARITRERESAGMNMNPFVFTWHYCHRSKSVCFSQRVFSLTVTKRPDVIYLFLKESFQFELTWCDVLDTAANYIQTLSVVKWKETNLSNQNDILFAPPKYPFHDQIL